MEMLYRCGNLGMLTAAAIVVDVVDKVGKAPATIKSTSIALFKFQVEEKIFQRSDGRECGYLGPILGDSADLCYQVRYE